MRSFGRIAVMVVVSLLTSALCVGGFKHALTGLIIAVIVCTLPLIGIITGLHFLERRIGPHARYFIASLGLSPLLLVMLSGARGDGDYMGAIILAGLAWSAAWLATAHAFDQAPRPEIAPVR